MISFLIIAARESATASVFLDRFSVGLIVVLVSNSNEFNSNSMCEKVAGLIEQKERLWAILSGLYYLSSTRRPRPHKKEWLCTKTEERWLTIYIIRRKDDLLCWSRQNKETFPVLGLGHFRSLSVPMTPPNLGSSGERARDRRRLWCSASSPVQLSTPCCMVGSLLIAFLSIHCYPSMILMQRKHSNTFYLLMTL